MLITDPLSFAGHLVGFAALSWKTMYDLIWNPRRFKDEIHSMDELKAARKKRERADKTTAITFFLLAGSYLLFIIGSVL